MKYTKSDKPELYYPWLGDPKPATGSQVLLLTEGRVLIRGTWSTDGSCIAWSPLPDPDNYKYQKSLEIINDHKAFLRSIKE